MDQSVNPRGVRLSPAEEKLGLLIIALTQHREHFAHHRGAVVVHNPYLQIGEQFHPAALHILVHLVGEGRRRAARLGGVGENPRPLHPEGQQEFTKFFELLLCLPRKSCDQTGA